MEAVTEFIKALGERFRNPFLFSFAVALVLWNWELPIAMFWQYETGSLTLREFIRRYDVLTCWPLVIAIGYCILIPLLSQAIQYYETVVNTKGNKLSLEKA